MVKVLKLTIYWYILLDSNLFVVSTFIFDFCNEKIYFIFRNVNLIHLLFVKIKNIYKGVFSKFLSFTIIMNISFFTNLSWNNTRTSLFQAQYTIHTNTTIFYFNFKHILHISNITYVFYNTTLNLCSIIFVFLF